MAAFGAARAKEREFARRRLSSDHGRSHKYYKRFRPSNAVGVHRRLRSIECEAHAQTPAGIWIQIVRQQPQVRAPTLPTKLQHDQRTEHACAEGALRFRLRPMTICQLDGNAAVAAPAQGADTRP